MVRRGFSQFGESERRPTATEDATGPNCSHVILKRRNGRARAETRIDPDALRYIQISADWSELWMFLRLYMRMAFLVGRPNKYTKFKCRYGKALFVKLR